jgi:tricorn protease
MKIHLGLLALASALTAAFAPLPLAAVPADAGAGSAAATPSEARLMRFPATDGSQIVFSYADQLYMVGRDGGVARRLTDGPGYAVFPHFSPDGKQLAFTAQYDGNTEVYVMPAGGGTPKRLTYTATAARDDLGDRMGPNNIVVAWKHRSPEVVFRSRMRSFNDFIGSLYAVGPDGDLPRQVPVPRGGFASFSPDDTKMAYNRIFREFRTWKDYRGGMADDIWIFDFKTGALEDITNNPASDIMPMWGPDQRIYFISDRDGRMNLFSYDLATKATVQHTHFKDFDIKFPSLGGSAIVFEQAGYVWRFDLADGTTHRVPIVISEDFATARGGLINVGKFVATVHLAPNGKRVVVNARGATYTVPAKAGPTRTLSGTSGVHERDAVWSPDGRWIAYLSDASGENELYVRPQDGSGTPSQLTQGADTYYYAPVWSPDSQKLLWSDRLQRLRIVTVKTKAVALVDHATKFEIRQYAWSPDSQWVTWARPEDTSLDKVWLYSLATGKKFAATDGWYEASAPAFSDDGKYLVFASGRDFSPTYSEIEWEHVFRNLERVYLVTLAKATPSPFAPKSDEGELAAGDGTKLESAAAGAAAAPTSAASPARGSTAAAPAGVPKADAQAVVVQVDEDGLRDRVIGLPIKASNYDSIRVVGDKVYYLRREADDGEGEEGGGGPPALPLLAYDLKEQKETELGRVTGYEISADGKRMLVQTGKDYAVIDVPAAKIEAKDKLNFAGLEFTLDRHAEWQEVYDECWRQMRDFFFSPTMNGVDWAAQRAKYAALVPFAQTRYDLTYLIGELIGEIHSGHTYVGGGDAPKAPRIPMGLLGAELSRDPASRAYRIDRILQGENWAGATRSPLTEIGVNVRVGDYILAVNGRPVRNLGNIYAALAGTVGRQVVLRVNGKPVEAGARDVTVVPIGDEGPLYYYDWVQQNIDHVAQVTGGRVGYLHIPDMGPAGLEEFAKHFYPQLRKKALIIDERGNGGGNVSPMIIERLRREMVMAEKPRNATPYPNPGDLQLGPKVVLMNEFSASDGDIFPYRFKTDGIGKLIGKRSWGGVVGIRGSLPIVDGGFLMKPEYAPYAKDGKDWPIEGHGVDPDIVVDNDPAKEFAGVDQQLDAAIAEVLTELKTQEQDLPPPPPYPNRSHP